MNVTMTHNDSELTVAIEGRLDTLTAPELEEQLEPELDEAEKLTFDMEGLEYISSAGLRVLLTAQKMMNAQGEMYITGCSEDILDIFEITGFSQILTLK